ncbi:MAG: signal peptide peptidase SppA [Halobaculum sp.]|jgi:protease-4
MAHDTRELLLRVVAVLGTLTVALVVGYVAFVRFPASLAELLGVLLTLGLAAVGVRGVSGLVSERYPDYNTAEVTVEGAISRDGGGGPLPTTSSGACADDVVDQIEAADDDPNAEALLVTLNTPGGEVLPSDDIRRAAAAFDGPTVAHARDTCASGGYWIAVGCDEFWAHDLSQVGSIGVIASLVNVNEFLTDRGISYERFAAGEYKDARLPVKEMDEDDREYLQGTVDELYDEFVDRVAAGRDLDPETVRETEARVYLGREAADRGLVDELGDRDAVEERLGDLLGADCEVETFEPERGLRDRLAAGTRRVAYAFGAGVTAHVTPDDEVSFELK